MSYFQSWITGARESQLKYNWMTSFHLWIHSNYVIALVDTFHACCSRWLFPAKVSGKVTWPWRLQRQVMTSITGRFTRSPEILTPTRSQQPQAFSNTAHIYSKRPSSFHPLDRSNFRTIYFQSYWIVQFWPFDSKLSILELKIQTLKIVRMNRTVSVSRSDKYK